MFRPHPRWAFGFLGGYWRWNGSGRCPRASPDQCGFSSMRAVPVVVFARFRLDREAPLFYFHTDGGNHRLSWTYTDGHARIPHPYAESYFGAGLGVGAVLPAGGQWDLEISVTMNEVWTDPQKTRYVKILFGLALSDDPRRQVVR